MDFKYPSSKKEAIEWLYWFFNKKYSKSSFRKKDVIGWYLKLRLKDCRRAC